MRDGVLGVGGPLTGERSGRSGGRCESCRGLGRLAAPAHAAHGGRPIPI